MTEPSILAVAGLRGTSPEFRSELFKLAARNAWNVDHLAAAISSESGFKASAKNPMGSASGIIQMINATALSLGIVDGAEGVRRMSAEQQLPYVEKYFQRAFKNLSGAPQRVDFYLALWGARPGLPMSAVLSRAGDKLYPLNAALDVDKSGVITVSDLDARLAAVQKRANEERVPVDLRLPGGPSPLPFSSLSESSLLADLRALVARYEARL